MKTVILIFDEDSVFTENIKNDLENIDGFNFILTQTVVDAHKAIDKYKPSLAIVSTRMGRNSSETRVIVRYLRVKYQIPVIFTSNFLDDKKEMLEYAPVVFVPMVELKEVIKFIHKSPNMKISEELKDSIFISKNKRHYKVPKKDICYVYADYGCIKIITKNGNFLLSSTLSSFKAQIDDTNFISIHRSYLVNTIHIDSFDSHNLFISNDSIPISKKGMGILLEKIKRIKSK